MSLPPSAAPRRIAAISALSLGLLTPAIAQGPPAPPPEEPEESEEPAQPGPRDDPTPTIVITPGSAPREVLWAPYTTVTVDRERLERRQPRTTPQAFADIPGVLVQETAHGQGSPFIRGFTGFRNVLSIDGVRLNNSVFRSGPNQYWATVDQSSIERFDLVKGPASVLYGSDAIGGSINAFTRSPRTEPGAGFGGNLFYRYASAEESHIARAEVDGALAPDWYLLAGATVKSFGDVQGGRDIGNQPETGYDEYDRGRESCSPLRSGRGRAADDRLHQARAARTDVPRTHAHGLRGAKLRGQPPWAPTCSATWTRTARPGVRAARGRRGRAARLRNGLFDRLQAANVSWHHQEEEQRPRSAPAGCSEMHRLRRSNTLGTVHAQLEKDFDERSGTFSPTDSRLLPRRRRTPSVAT